MENVQEKLGAKLLPILATVANAVSKFLSEIDRGTGLGGRFADIVSDAFSRVKGAVEAALPTAAKVFETLKTAISGVVGTVRDLVKGFQAGEGRAVAIVSVIGGLAAGVAAAVVVMKTIALATKVWAAAQAALNVVMSANPIGLVIVGLVALGAGLVIAYKKSETFRKIVDASWKAIRDTTMTVLNWLVPAVKTAFGVVADVVRVAVGVVKGYVHAYAAAAKAIVTAIIDAFNFLKALPGKVAGYLSDTTKKIRGWVGNFASAAVDIGKGIGKGIIDGLGSLGHLILAKAKDALGFVTKNLPGVGAAIGVGKALGSLVGDGVGKTVGALGAGLPSGTFGGGLHGARASMAPFAAAGARFGLRVSSGRDDHSKMTSSGNVSYHSTGEALDLAGSPDGMMGFFRQMKAKFGGRLAELIYGPGRVGVKNGQPYNFGAALNAQHMDHVHVAYDTGVPGPGDGIGFEGLESLWVQGRGSANMAPLMAHIAQAESGGNPNARNPSGASGLWQILGQPFPGNVLDPLTNARMAVWKYKHQGLGAWAASRGTWGKYVGSGETYSPGGSRRSSGGSSRPKTYKKNQTASGGALGGYDPTVVYASENAAAENLPDPFTGMVGGAAGFAQRQKSRVLSGRALKGGGPTKGISAAEGERRANLPAGPTQWDWIDAAMAEARLTPGTEDDIQAAQWNYNARGSALDAARASGDPRAVSQAATDLASARDALLGLTDAINQANEIQRERDELNTTIAANQTKILALANQGPQIVAAVVAAVSGGIGGQVGLGMQTPGFAGQVARY
jgi:hypothetical protein